MNCFCEDKKTNHLKVEGDVGADPVWCSKCGCNFDIEDVPVSQEFQSELMDWSMQYGEWIDWDKDELYPNGIQLEEEHNRQGRKLTEKLKEKLGDQYHVTFSPSSSAKSYARWKGL